MTFNISFLKNKIWRFGIFGRRDHCFGNIVLRDDGRVSGYKHPNECYWHIDDDKLYFRNVHMDNTTIFSFSEFSETNWRGDVLSGAQHSHYLTINRTYPVIVEYNSDIAKIAKNGRFYLRHFKGIDDVYQIGDRITVYPNSFIEPSAALPKGGIFKMGAFSYFAGSADCNVSIGRYCSIAEGNRTFGNSHPAHWLTSNPVSFAEHHFSLFDDAEIMTPPSLSYFYERNDNIVTTVGNDVWIGGECLLKPGIHIGDGAIIASRSIVTKDVPPFAVVGGAPARILKYRFPEQTIEKLLKLRWWDLDVGKINIRWDNVDHSIDMIERSLSMKDNTLSFNVIDYSIPIIETQVLEGVT